MSSTDTIFALATAPGRSGVAVLRLSGPQAATTVQQLTGLPALTPRHAHYAPLRHPSGDIVDRGLALYFPAPHSFTGEDVAELHLHGSLAVIRDMLALLAGLPGLRMAEPGEFTRRAFMNGKMDLLEAEGLADLIAAETKAQRVQAMQQMQGASSGYYHDLRTGIIRVLAHLEAYIDFPDEDIPETVLTSLDADTQRLQTVIQTALQDGKRGERVRDGISVVILGAPNAGKSSLLNAMARRDAAIVSTRAGTTRDIIEVHLDIAGFPVILVDTAGIRDSSDDIEEEGVRRALARSQTADIRLVLYDGAYWPSRDAASDALLDDSALMVVNKSDALPTDAVLPESAIAISARTGQGVDHLLREVEKRIITFFCGEAAPFITQNRHRQLLSEAFSLLEASRRDLPLELKCEELRRAAQAVGKITGKIQVDDVLDVLFRQFCIGK